MYLLGCFAMLAAGQLTATSLNAVGIFCFVFAAAAALVYYAMRVVARFIFTFFLTFHISRMTSFLYI